MTKRGRKSARGSGVRGRPSSDEISDRLRAASKGKKESLAKRAKRGLQREAKVLKSAAKAIKPLVEKTGRALRDVASGKLKPKVRTRLAEGMVERVYRARKDLPKRRPSKASKTDTHARLLQAQAKAERALRELARAKAADAKAAAKASRRPAKASATPKGKAAKAKTEKLTKARKPRAAPKPSGKPRTAAGSPPKGPPRPPRRPKKRGGPRKPERPAKKKSRFTPVEGRGGEFFPKKRKKKPQKVTAKDRRRAIAAKRERAAKKRKTRRRREAKLKRAIDRGDRVAQLKALHAIYKQKLISASKHRTINTAYRSGIIHAFQFGRVLQGGPDVLEVIDTVRRWATGRQAWSTWNAVAFFFTQEKVSRDVASGSPKAVDRLGKSHPEVTGATDSTGALPSAYAMLEELEELLTGWVEAAKRHDEPILLDWIQVSAANDRSTSERQRWVKRAKP